jgi:hypothetical protein
MAEHNDIIIVNANKQYKAGICEGNYIGFKIIIAKGKYERDGKTKNLDYFPIISYIGNNNSLLHLCSFSNSVKTIAKDKLYNFIYTRLTRKMRRNGDKGNYNWDENEMDGLRAHNFNNRGNNENNEENGNEDKKYAYSSDESENNDYYYEDYCDEFWGYRIWPEDENGYSVRRWDPFCPRLRYNLYEEPGDDLFSIQGFGNIVENLIHNKASEKLTNNTVGCNHSEIIINKIKEVNLFDYVINRLKNQDQDPNFVLDFAQPRNVNTYKTTERENNDDDENDDDHDDNEDEEDEEEEEEEVDMDLYKVCGFLKID